MSTEEYEEIVCAAVEINPKVSLRELSSELEILMNNSCQRATMRAL